jgi:fructokinase
MTILGAVELGGTKTLVGSGTSIEDLTENLRLDTASPELTLAEICEHLESAGVGAVGVASFGPIELRREHERYGYITTTPKPGWSSTNVAGFVAERLSVPVGFDTDVNGAGLGEWKWGASAGLRTSVYLTVGTGIGGGVIVDGTPLRGLSHPEIGHGIVAPLAGDTYPGRCPYHQKCLEGMASGPAIADRFGRSPTELDAVELNDALRLVSFYVAQGLRNLVYTVSPERIVVGGGVSNLPGFHRAVREELTQRLADYPGLPEYEAENFVVAPALGDLSGLAGAMLLAEEAIGA